MNDSPRSPGDERALRFERRLPHAPEKVWRAVTEPEQLSQWYPFTVAELDPQLGGVIRFRDEEGTESRAEITEFVPPNVFAFREHDEQTGTHELRLELEPDGEGCRLTFTHSFTDAFAETPWAGQAETGWVHCLDALKRALAEAA